MALYQREIFVRNKVDALNKVCDENRLTHHDMAGVSSLLKVKYHINSFTRKILYPYEQL